MIKNKKLMLSLGLVAIASTPIIATVSCGDKTETAKPAEPTSQAQLDAFMNTVALTAAAEGTSTIAALDALVTSTATTPAEFNSTLTTTLGLSTITITSKPSDVNLTYVLTAGTTTDGIKSYSLVVTGKTTATPALVKAKAAVTIKSQTPATTTVYNSLNAKISQGAISTTSKDKVDVAEAYTTPPTTTTAFDSTLGTSLFTGVDLKGTAVAISKNLTANTFDLAISKAGEPNKTLAVKVNPLASRGAPLDLTETSSVKITQMREIYALIYGTATLDNGGYDFTMKPTAQATPLEWFMKKSQVEAVRNTTYDPNMPMEQVSYEDFIAMMKDATGTALTPGGMPQWRITTMEEDFLGLNKSFAGAQLPTIGDNYDDAKTRDFILNKFIKVMPPTVQIKRTKAQNSLTNNFEVEFVKAADGTAITPEVLTTVQFNCDVVGRTSGESDVAYQARVDALNAATDTAKGNMFSDAIDKIKIEYRTFTRRVEQLFVEMKKSGVTSNAVARTLISAMLDLSYDMITGAVPVYGTIKGVPGLGSLTTKIDNFVKGQFIPPTTNWLADKLFPTTGLMFDSTLDVNQIYA